MSQIDNTPPIGAQARSFTIHKTPPDDFQPSIAAIHKPNPVDVQNLYAERIKRQAFDQAQLQDSIDELADKLQLDKVMRRALDLLPRHHAHQLLVSAQLNSITINQAGENMVQLAKDTS